MRDSQKISDVALRSTLTPLTSLRALDLSYIVPLSDDTLREVRRKPLPPLPGLHIEGSSSSSCTGMALTCTAYP